MRKKQALKVNKLWILMKNLMYLKNDFVSKESFSRENPQMGLRQFDPLSSVCTTLRTMNQSRGSCSTPFSDRQYLMQGKANKCY